MQKSRITIEAWPENLRTPEAAAYLGISISTITKLRMAANRHNSPPFVKIAGCVIYRRKDLDEWLKRHLVRSGSDYRPVDSADAEAAKNRRASKRRR